MNLVLVSQSSKDFFSLFAKTRMHLRLLSQIIVNGIVLYEDVDTTFDVRRVNGKGRAALQSGLLQLFLLQILKDVADGNTVNTLCQTLDFVKQRKRMIIVIELFLRGQHITHLRILLLN